MIAEGAFEKVRETRILFQDWMREPFTQVVTEATGRSVRAFASQVTHDPDVAVELFLLVDAADGPNADGPNADGSKADGSTR